jgi:exopolysaccharide biosynthesis WecB/TagA/CpsF family protein
VSLASGLAAPLPSRYPVGEVLVSGATYGNACAAILESARRRQSLLVAATSVHGVTIGATNQTFRAELNAFDIVTPDGQPVRWALNLLHRADVPERVYGPTLMLQVCRAAARDGLSVYLYGGRPEVLERLVDSLQMQVPGLQIAGHRSPPFGRPIVEADAEDVRAIRESGAGLVFVALGCPRQEHWAYVHREQLSMPIVCVGAAFDFLAGTLKQAPVWMQKRGLEWFFRLMMEPRRLWRRYATIVPFFFVLVTRQYAAQLVQRRSP